MQLSVYCLHVSEFGGQNAGTVEVDGHVSSAPSPWSQTTYQSVQCNMTTLAGNTVHTHVFNLGSTCLMAFG
jgi:hypothetical protein